MRLLNEKKRAGGGGGGGGGRRGKSKLFFFYLFFSWIFETLMFSLVKSFVLFQSIIGATK